MTPEQREIRQKLAVLHYAVHCSNNELIAMTKSSCRGIPVSDSATASRISWPSVQMVACQSDKAHCPASGS